MENERKNSQNRSMFLYTALIFAVALLLIIIAFFGQANKEKVDNIVEKTATETATAAPTEAASETDTEPAVQFTEEYAKLSNKVIALDAENNALKAKLDLYELLLSANKSISEGDIETAKNVVAEINSDTLTDDQKILFNQITLKINE